MRTTMPQRRRTKGQALVEFALMATLIFFLLSAAVDIGLIFFTLQGLHNAAQEGATYGSRWGIISNNSGVIYIDEDTIRDRARHEAGNQGIGFANLLDLNNNGTPDVNPDQSDGFREQNPETGNQVVVDYIQVQSLLDSNRDGSVPDDDAGVTGSPDACPNPGNVTLSCFIRVTVSYEYRMVFALAPVFGDTVRLTSSYSVPVRSGYRQAGEMTQSPVIRTVTPTPSPTSPPTATPTTAPSPTPCTTPGTPSLNGSRSGGNVNLSWSAVSGATSYEVFRSTSSSGSLSSWRTVSGTSTTDSIPNSRTYRYQVRAVNGCGQTGPLSNMVTITR
jgi:hypothetical protein